MLFSFLKISAFLILSLSLSSYSYIPNQAYQTEVSTASIDLTKLCKTWYVVSGEMVEGNETEEFPEELKNSQFIFNPDFTFILKEKGSKDHEKGSWKELKGDKLLVDLDDDPVTFTIVSLTENRLEMTAVDGSTDVRMILSTIATQ